MKNLHNIERGLNEDQLAVIWFSIQNDRRVRNNRGVIEYYNHTFLNWSDTWFHGANLEYIKGLWRTSKSPKPDLSKLEK